MPSVKEMTYPEAELCAKAEEIVASVPPYIGLTGDALRLVCRQVIAADRALRPEAVTTVYQAPTGFKLMPKEPTDAMMRALEGYYAKWQGILGKKNDTALKADCWSAYHAYLAMYEAAPITETLVSPLGHKQEKL